MYVSYFNLAEKAFEARPSTPFLWNGESRAVLVENLCSGLLEENGFQVLTGDAGVGKTTLLQQVLAEVAQQVNAVSPAQLPADIVQFYNDVLSGFGLSKEVFTRLQFVMELSRLLKDFHAADKKALLAIDNAEKLSQDFYEELRTLIGLEKDGRRLLNIMLIGRPQLIDALSASPNRVLRQKMALHAELKPLSAGETREYVLHRLAAAGGTEPIFDEGCYPLLHDCTGGLPGGINTLCTLAMEEAAEQDGALTTDLITACALKQEGAFQESDVKIDQVSETLAREGLVGEEPAAAVVSAISALKENVREKMAQEAVGEPEPAPIREEPQPIAINPPAAERVPEEPLQQEQEEEEPQALLEESSGDRWLALALRGLVALAICLVLYFIYDRLSAPDLSMETPLDRSSAAGSPANTDRSVTADGVPLVVPDRPTGSLAPLKTNELKTSRPGPAGSGRIEVYPLEIIEGSTR